MPLTSFQIQRYFRIFGKIILLGQRGDAFALQIRKLMAAAVDQAVSGVPEEFATITTVLNPMTTSMAKMIASVDVLPAAAVSYAAVLLQQVVAVDMGLPAKTSIATVGAALIDDME